MAGLRDRRIDLAVLIGGCAVFVAAAYLPDVGRGFVKDDFGWIAASRDGFAHLRTLLFPTGPGFYRPIVSVSFAIDYTLHGLEPRGYGVTNLALYLACGAALYAFARSATLSARASALAAFAWAVNPHGINMAVLWLSGRTELLLTLASLLAATAYLRRRYGVAAICTLAALGSKEEAVALPVMIIACAYLVRGREWRRLDWIVGPAALVVCWVIYAVARAQTGAFTPGTAPSYYQLSIHLQTVARNALQYLDRGATIDAIVLAVACLVAWTVPRLEPGDGRVLLAALVWFCGGFAVTVFLPIRSSLYAVFPSVGAAVACGLLVDRLAMPPASAARRSVVVAAVLAAAVIAAIPIYRQRDGRFVEPAKLSTEALRVIVPSLPADTTRTVVVLVDQPIPPSGFIRAFGTLGSVALRLYTGRPLEAWIDPPPSELAAARPAPDQVLATYALDGGKVVKVN